MDNLEQIAIYHFKKMRTKCEFLKISDCQVRGDVYIFHALFQCKHYIAVKKITLDKQGNLFF